jgi:hypothetical protein
VANLGDPVPRLSVTRGRICICTCTWSSTWTRDLHLDLHLNLDLILDLHLQVTVTPEATSTGSGGPGGPAFPLGMTFPTWAARDSSASPTEDHGLTSMTSDARRWGRVRTSGRAHGRLDTSVG